MNSFPFYSVGVSETGWTDRGHAAKWIVDVFLPTAIKHVTDPTKPILLIIDGHDSHECLEIKAAVYRNTAGYVVIVLCFPSKCTHKLQPLDVAIFNHTQTHWKARCDELIDKGVQITRYNVIPEYMKIRHRFMTKKLLEYAFAATGIHPLNPNVFTDEDYAPSQAFSITAHAPESYPDPVPSSDFAIPSDAESDSEDADYEDSESSDEESTDSEDEGDVEIADVDFYGGYGWCTTMSSDGGWDLPGVLETDCTVDVPDESDSDLSGWGSDKGEWDDGTSAEGRPALRWWSRTDVPAKLAQTPSRNRSSTPMPLVRTTRSVSRTHSEVLSTPLPALSREALEGLSHEDLVTYALKLQSRSHAFENALQQTEALRLSSDSHCTIVLRQLTDEKTRSENARQKSRRGSAKIKARVVIAPDLKDHFEREEIEAKEREREAKEKELAKSLEAAARDKRIVEAANSRIFSGSLSSYTRKEDLVGLTRALQIIDSGTNPELKERIQHHLDDHPELANNEHFAMLFNRRRARRLPPTDSNPSSLPSNHDN
jgi:hypothetical protein